MMKETMAWRCRACDGFVERLLIIMVNVIPPNHVDDVHVVEPDQHDDVPVIPEYVLADEDEDPEEDEFKEEEDPQEEEEDMEVDIEEDENDPELTYPYEETDPLNPPPPASESEPDDAIEVENPIEHEDETLPARVHEVCESSTAPFLYEDSDDLLPSLMRRDINSLFGQIASVLRRLYGREKAQALVKKKGKAKDEFYGTLILDLGKELCSKCQKSVKNQTISNTRLEVYSKSRINGQFSTRNQPMKPKCQKNLSSGSILANYQKSNQGKKGNQSFKG
nr:hypothetical protein [Tanacetum cinerariifolium]